MSAPAPLITQPTVAPAPAGSRSTPVGADVQQGRGTSPTLPSTQPVIAPSGSGPTPTGVDVKHIQVPAPSIARVPAGPAIRLGNTKAANNPGFTKVMGKLEQSAAKSREHPPATQKSAEAQAASMPPTNERLTAAESNKVDTMHDAPTRQPDSESFLTLLRAEIAKVMPKNLGDTDNFMKGGKKQQLKQATTGNVNQQKDAATAGMQSASKAPPNTAQVQGKQVVPLRPGGPPPAPPAIGAADAVPAPRSDAEVSQQKNKDDANNRMTSAHVTPEQLKKANDPRFSAVLSAKAAVDKHADAAPKNYRADEHKTLTQATAQAIGEEKKGLGAFQGLGSQAAAQVQGKQLTAKAKDEAARKQVTDHIQSIYDATKQTIDNKLSTLEKEVGDIFDKGVNTALANMTSYIDDRMGKWKFQRYLSNLMGPFLWVRDQFLPLPDEVNVFYTEGRQRFTQELDRLIVQIATLVDTRLKEAKDEIANGQKKISDYVKGLPANLQAVGKAAEQDMASRFDEMRQAVDDKKNELAQSLAQKYKEASDKADAKIKEMQDQNKGLLSSLIDTLGTVVKILTEFRDRIMGMLRQGKAAIDLIVADPIGFLRNLLNALKQGLMQFIRNICNHLKVGFMKWLLGSLAGMGIIVPPDFSLGSILQLVLQVLGLTYDRIRAKVVKYIGERNVEILEKAVQMISTLLKAGPAALWEQIKENLSNLKEMVIDSLQSWLVTTVIQGAVMKLASMFTPVGAIIQAIITIYNTVTFFIERINQILDFVQAIFSSVLNIARGNIAGAANWIEQALARSLPVIIGFLAALIGVTGITAKIRSIIQKVQNKIDAALDKLIQKIVNTVKKLLGKVIAGVKKLAQKAVTGVKKLVGKAKSARHAVLKKLGIGKGKKDEREDKDEDVKEEVKQALAQRLPKSVTSPDQVRSVFNEVFEVYSPRGLKSLEFVEIPKKLGEFEVYAVASPKAMVGGPVTVRNILGIRVSDLTSLGRGTTLIADLRVEGRIIYQKRVDAKGGPHAEEILLADLNANWNTLGGGILQNSKVQTQLTIHITRSPCGPQGHNCASQLANFQASKKNFTIVLRMLTLYRGKSGIAYGSSIIGLQTLSRAGVRLSVWDVVQAIERNNPGVLQANITPDDQATLERRIADLRNELKSYHLIR